MVFVRLKCLFKSTKFDFDLTLVVDSQAPLRADRKPDRSRWPEEARPEVRPAAEWTGAAWRTPPPPPRPPRRSSEVGGYLCPSLLGQALTPSTNLTHTLNIR